jgi:biopolymer transport protein ExbD
MLRQPRRPSNDDDRILPLINVVFLLMIFFMLAGRISAIDPFPVEPPQPVNAGSNEDQETIVLVGADGRLALDGRIMDEDSFATAIADWVMAHEGGRVRLKADGNAEATRVVIVMETLRTAGVEKLRLMTLPGTR